MERQQVATRYLSIVAVTAGLLAGPLAVPAVAGAQPLQRTAPAASPAPVALQQQPSTARPGSGRTSVLLQLADADPAGLARLAQAKGLTATQRALALAAAGPSAVTRTTVVARLKALGLQVDNQNRYGVLVSGPTPLVDAVFGKAQSRFDGPHAGKSTAQGAVVPSPVAGLVKFALSSDQPGLRMHPLLVHRPAVPSSTNSAQTLTPGTGEITGAMARALYGDPSSTGVISTPSLTIATTQFSGWNSSDLSTFAAQQVPGLPDPVASGQFTPVNWSLDPSTPDGYGGDVEVALDQESLLATAPNAAQRAYFISNNSTTLAYVNLLDRIATDAATVTPRLTALSISWGLCEQGYAPSDITSLDSAFQTLTAAGVTVFAAAGDAGAYDCDHLGSSSPLSPGTPAVDYPASSPYVVAVGGLTTRSPENPNSPGEAVWWSGSGWGGGGGQSAVEPRPAWQPPNTAVPGSNRLVPDISLAADPTNGGWFAILTSDNGPYGCTATSSPVWCGVGGTSLASPLAAATLTDWEIGTDPTVNAGLGAIGPALYAYGGATRPWAFRDVALGSNGAFCAALGYDEASGLGAPFWSGFPITAGLPMATPTTSPSCPNAAGWYRTNVTVAWHWTDSSGSPDSSCPNSSTATLDSSDAVLSSTCSGSGGSLSSAVHLKIDKTAPTVSSTGGLNPTSGTRASIRWAGADGGSGVAGYRVSLVRVGTSTNLLTSALTTSTWAGPYLTRGATYVFTARSVDKAGNTSAASAFRFAVPLAAASFSFSSGWGITYAPGSIAGVRRVASKLGTGASISFTAKQYKLLFTTCPSCGEVAVYLDGRLSRVVSTYSSTTRDQVAAYYVSFLTAGRHSLYLKVLHAKVSASAGNYVMLDGLMAVN